MNEEDADPEFSIPSEMVDKLYELSGGVDKDKVEKAFKEISKKIN